MARIIVASDEMSANGFNGHGRWIPMLAFIIGKRRIGARRAMVCSRMSRRRGPVDWNWDLGGTVVGLSAGMR